MSEDLKHKTASGLAWGAVNSLMTQLLGVVIGIFLARLLSPGEYGMVGMLAIFSAIAGSLQESGFTAALTNLSKATHREYNAVFWFSSAVSVSLYLILYICSPLIAQYFHQPELVGLSHLMFASFVMAGIGTAHSAYMFRNMMNKEKAIMSVAALVVSGTVGITLAWMGYSYWSLAWQQFAYITVIDLGRLYYVRWLPSLKVDFAPIREMFGFSSKLLLTNIINQVNNNVLSVIFGRLFTPAVVGNFAQASKWNTMGHSIISGSIQQVAQPVLASVNEEEGRQVKIFRKMLRFAAFLSMPAMLGLASIADFVPLLLGEQWDDAVVLLRILCVSGAFMPLHTLYQNLFISHGRSDTYMWCILSQLLVQTGTILLFSAFGVTIMVAAYSVVLILWLGVWQWLARRLIGLHFREVAMDVCPFLLIAATCVGLGWGASVIVPHPALSIAVRIVVAALLYIIVMKVSGAQIFKECVQFLLKKNN